MQVNVKELTGVSHLKLVFMNVLVLQSFLAVSLPSVTIFPSFSSASVTTFLKFFKLFKYSPSSQVLAPCVVESFQVFRLYFFQAPSVWTLGYNHGRSSNCAFTGLDGLLLHFECELLALTVDSSFTCHHQSQE